MMELAYDPPLDQIGDSPLVQTIRLMDDGKPAGRACWHCSAPGIVQILELEIPPDRQRKGLGAQLLESIIAQAQSHCRKRRQPIRQVWMAVRQKSQVLGRAFLTDHGFHHVGTLPKLLPAEDLLIYLKSYV
jgi:GNAT superfamily N-acetyltransferase